MAFWLILLGFIIQALGVAVTAYGATNTWHDYATEPFPPKEWVLVRVRRFNAWFQRIVLRRRQRQIVGHGAIVTGGGAIRVRGHMGWGPLTARTAKAQIAELEQRMKDLANSTFTKTDALEDSITALQREVAGVGSRLDETTVRLDRQTRTVAVGGIVWESFGLLLLVIGLAFQALGFVIDAAASGAG